MVSQEVIVGNHNVVIGSNNQIKGNHNRIIGNENQINGDYNRVTGDQNKIKGKYNKASGKLNTLDEINNKASDEDNKDDVPPASINIIGGRVIENVVSIGMLNSSVINSAVNVSSVVSPSLATNKGESKKVFHNTIVVQNDQVAQAHPTDGNKKK